MEGIYHGDFLISIDGEGVSEMSDQEVNRCEEKNFRSESSFPVEQFVSRRITPTTTSRRDRAHFRIIDLCFFGTCFRKSRIVFLSWNDDHFSVSTNLLCILHQDPEYKFPRENDYCDTDVVFAGESSLL